MEAGASFGLSLRLALRDRDIARARDELIMRNYVTPMELIFNIQKLAIRIMIRRLRHILTYSFTIAKRMIAHVITIA